MDVDASYLISVVDERWMWEVFYGIIQRCIQVVPEDTKVINTGIIDQGRALWSRQMITQTRWTLIGPWKFSSKRIYLWTSSAGYLCDLYFDSNVFKIFGKH